jgi:putative nucleotidyltransferase with HDIG domain
MQKPYQVKTLQRLSALHKAALATNSTMGLDRLLYDLLEVTMKTLDSQIGYILLYDYDQKKFHVCAYLNHSGNAEIHGEFPLLPKSVSTWVFNTRKPVLIRNIEYTPQFAKQSMLGHEQKSLICVPLMLRDEIIGTMSVVNKADDSVYTPDVMDMLATIASQATFAINNAKLYDEQQKVCTKIVDALLTIMDASDSYTRAHSVRVSNYAVELAKRINLSPDRIEILERAAILHDIGKIGIEEYLLNKNKRLSRKEIYSLRKHPLIGMKILEPLDFLRDVSICIGQHHERIDGQGYPFGIPGEKLLVESRILAIADAFDAMTSDRPYRRALSRDEALRELMDNAGKQHDSDLVLDFVRLVKSGAIDTPVNDAVFDSHSNFMQYSVNLLNGRTNPDHESSGCPPARYCSFP